MISMDNIYFSYTGKAPFILEDISLHIKKGDYISIIGENGSGKSTLVKLMLKFISPIKGKISINTSNIGYVPQRVESFNSQFPITVYEVLYTHLKALKLKDTLIINEVLEMTGITNFKNELIGNLSGGQQQKVFIARSLMGKPDLLVLDELSNNVDSKSQKEIYGIIKKLNKDDNITVISIEHNIKTALNNSNYIFEMNENSHSLMDVKEYTNYNKTDNNED